MGQSVNIPGSMKVPVHFLSVPGGIWAKFVYCPWVGVSGVNKLYINFSQKVLGGQSGEGQRSDKEVLNVRGETTWVGYTWG